MNNAILTASGVFLLSMVISSAISWNDYLPSTTVITTAPAREATNGYAESPDISGATDLFGPTPETIPGVTVPDEQNTRVSEDSEVSYPAADAPEEPQPAQAAISDTAFISETSAQETNPSDLHTPTISQDASDTLATNESSDSSDRVAVGISPDGSPEPPSGISETQRLSSVQRISGTPAAVDSLLILIPERSWVDSSRIRGELTPEIAQQYPRKEFVPREIENTEWYVGEQLVFSVDYGFYQAGTATMSVLGEQMVNGGICYHIQTTARSNDFISKIYEVKDEVNSYIDKKGIFSRRIEQLLQEGNYRSNRYTDFYPERQIALNTERKYGLTEIPVYIQDVLSSLYRIRTYDLEVGKDIYITTYADGKVYPLQIKVEKIETTEVPAGKFRCYVVEPLLQSDGIFRQKGRLRVWLTADEHKIPVKMTSKIVIGSIGTNLVSYTLGDME
ncbi:DUF3108 domain-containing protein [Candidatus Latescibacterota bacterium]